MYKKLLLIGFVTLMCPVLCLSQGGTWVWMKGPNTPNLYANFGTQGVSDPGNNPSGLCGAAYWEDLDGNFWIFGGANLESNGVVYNNSISYSDLWKYEVATNTWT